MDDILEAGRELVTLRGKTWAMERLTLVSFDFHRLGRQGRSAVYRALYGRKVRIKGKVYRYPGLLHEGGHRVGQSVFALPEGMAGRLVALLAKHRVPHEAWEVLRIP